MNSEIGTKYYADYFWKNGRPRGLNGTLNLEGTSYKVIADPYFKRISIEKYTNQSFVEIIYDSAIFDFRHLKPMEQNGWEKKTVSETEQESVCHIRNQDDRLIFIENYFFENQICRECRTTSPHGILLSVQHILYENLGDSFNGVILYDTNNHMIMYKRYEFDNATQSFQKVLEECIDFSKAINESKSKLLN